MTEIFEFSEISIFFRTFLIKFCLLTMKEVIGMKKSLEVFDLKKTSEIYLRVSLILTLVIFILLFFLFPRYKPHPYVMRNIVGSTRVIPTDPIVKPVIPKPLPKPRIPVPTDNPNEIENAIIPTDSTLFERFGEEDPLAIPPPDMFIPCEKYPQLIYAPAPEYPSIARAAGIKGKVFLQLFVGKDGKPKKIFITKSEVTADCDSVAVKTAWNFRFSPALQRDKPIGVWVSMPIIFKLQ